MTRNLIALVLIALLNSGCTANLPRSEAQNPDMLDQYDRLYKSTIYPIMDVESLKKLMTLNTEFGKTRIGGVNEYRRIWCATEDISEIKRRVSNIADTHCRQLGGTMNEHWCRTKEDQPIFLAVAGDRELIGYSSIDNYCKPKKIASLVASTSENANPEDWKIRAMNTYRYAPLSEVLNQEKQANQYREKELVNRRVQAESNGTMVLARGVGRRACKESGIWTYSGIVNKIENDRIQVLVDIKSADGVKDRFFTSTVAVDAASKWFPCDTIDELNLHK
jgi:hypothetical protein